MGTEDGSIWTHVPAKFGMENSKGAIPSDFKSNFCIHFGSRRCKKALTAGALPRSLFIILIFHLVMLHYVVVWRTNQRNGLPALVATHPSAHSQHSPVTPGRQRHPAPQNLDAFCQFHWHKITRTPNTQIKHLRSLCNTYFKLTKIVWR
jgi:hypothetical protein